jgi:uncharacterized protein
MFYCCIVLVVAYAVRGSTGFGSAAAMPLLGLVIPIKILVPAWTLLGIASSATILGRDRQHVSGIEILRMLPTCLIGVATGLYFFKTLDAHTLAQGLGRLVICYGCYSLWIIASAREKRLQAQRLVAPLAGIAGGAVGTTFGTMASLFFAIYFDAVRMPKERLRAKHVGHAPDAQHRARLRLFCHRGVWPRRLGGSRGRVSNDACRNCYWRSLPRPHE